MNGPLDLSIVMPPLPSRVLTQSFILQCFILQCFILHCFQVSGLSVYCGAPMAVTILGAAL